MFRRPLSPSSSSSTASSASSETEWIPSDVGQKIEKIKFFHYRIHRVDVKPLLVRNGDFILRQMRQGSEQKYVVSVRWDGTIKHFPIQRVRGQFCFEGRYFKEIRSLIDAYVDSGSPVTISSGARLERARERQPWELLSRQIETKRQLGRGNFGVVYEAILTRPNQPPKEVAAKKLDIVSPNEAKFEAARTEMLEEARIMRLVTGHQNIVGAIGVTIDVEQPVAVMELVRGGSLERVLRIEKIPMDTKLRLCYEAAAGVKYIHSKRILHRDLAARNCLIERQKNGRLGCLKITDFGMARVISGDKIFYKAVTASQVPVAWSALESLEDFLWTAESDVWSLGVLIWEILSDGMAPYYDIEVFDRMAAIAYLRKGSRLDFPDEVHPSISQVVKECWEQIPSKRPSPYAIQEVLKKRMKRK